MREPSDTSDTTGLSKPVVILADTAPMTAPASLHIKKCPGFLGFSLASILLQFCSDLNCDTVNVLRNVSAFIRQIFKLLLMRGINPNG